MTTMILQNFEIIRNESAPLEIENGMPYFAEGGNYAAGDLVKFENGGAAYIYEAAAATDKSPAENPLFWIKKDTAGISRAFDEYMDTQAKLNYGNVIEILAQKVDSVYIGNLKGAIELLVYAGGLDDDGDPINAPFIQEEIRPHYGTMGDTGWHNYFFGQRYEMSLSRDVYRSFPAAFNLKIRITALSETAYIGAVKTGTSLFIGETKIAPSARIMDFSIKDTDEQGNTYLQKRRFSKRHQYDVILETSRFDRIYSLLSDIRAEPTIWIGSEAENGSKFEAFSCYGFYRDFSMLLSGEIYSECSLEIESLV